MPSRPLITKDRSGGSAGLRLPAEAIEQLVTGRVRQWLLDPGSIHAVTQRTDPSAQRRLIARAAELGKSWPQLPATRQRALLAGLVERIHRRQPDRSPCPRERARRALRWSSRAIGG